VIWSQLMVMDPMLTVGELDELPPGVDKLGPWK
jgi:hypothetical protein